MQKQENLKKLEEAAIKKKFFFLVARPLREGGKGLATKEKELFLKLQKKSKKKSL